MTTTSRSTTLIRQLPIQPRPRAGEGRTTFIERLATANYLKPSYLRSYLRDPDSPKTAPSWDRLAAVTGRDPVLLQEVLERRQCVECGRPLPIGDYLTARRRCSQACRQKSYRKRHPKPLKSVQNTNCRGCGKGLSYHRQPRQYCSHACRQLAYRTRMNAMSPPQIRAKSCQACETPLISGPTNKIYCSKRCARWAYINRRVIQGLPPLPQPAADIPRGIQPDCCVVCGTPLTRGAYGQVRLTCSGSCRAKRAYWRKKEKLTTTA
ncbi:hypothetical protein AB0K57_08540 [Streptomyces halstedii]|uniref:hypothetical protein n=1 Tax=Streptomyces halstedii TaxID=1944 RepID=UPI00345FFA34